MRITLTEAQFAELAMLYMTNHEKLTINWGEMAALSQQENTPILEAQITPDQCAECGSNTFIIRANNGAHCAHCDAPTDIFVPLGESNG